MGKIHYYFGWFNAVIPKQVAQALYKDIPDKKSLVIITTIPSDYKHTDEMTAFAKDIWFEPAGIIFEKYYSIDYRIETEEAHELIKNASAILLHGGNAAMQNAFLNEYKLDDAIKKSNAAVVMGASAGGMNMSAKWVNDYAAEIKIQDGLGLDNFAIQSHASCENIEILSCGEDTKKYLIPLSESIDVYVACEESTIRIKNGKFEVIGDVYLISKSNIQKMKEVLNFGVLPN